MQAIEAIHHVTAVTGDPLVNTNFYQRVLGQRLVKTTVNYDDPGTYHLYYGDAMGTPGTVLSFLVWPGARPGIRGTGEAVAVAYAIRPESIPYWEERLADFGVAAVGLEEQWGSQTLSLRDRDGMPIQLVATEQRGPTRYWDESPVPTEHALRGLFGVTLEVTVIEPTAHLLTDHLGFRATGREGNRWRYEASGRGPGLVVNVLLNDAPTPGRVGAGSIHHIALRVPDVSTQLSYQRHLSRSGLALTPVKDRKYYHSIDFREPGRVLFEIATDQPGFAVDEPVAELGRRLQLPLWLEAHRQDIEAALPPFLGPGEARELVQSEQTL